MQKSSKIILGIDPGTLLMGYSVISVTASVIKVVEMDVLRLSAKKDNYERLHMIHQRVSELIQQFKPKYCAIEAPFFGKNVQSMLKLGRAQGVAIAAAMQSGLEVHEYSPKKIKQSITGNGNADKEQVWKMLQQMLHLQDAWVHTHDMSDALAVAVCHHFQDKPFLGNQDKVLKGWDDFLKKNPGRIRSSK
ncbi:crossover junction endodeoxyribonuclease RuvC [Pseudoflavitalea sp. G-6-1-2]|uniref:crossover junction endodeoxyribonuclease RuvC n=1 Tax=Pseudoflavitalea sp. G-6-1-2 TaxID=2728841 RepID=UPI00146E3ED8|nr:crossover junction endodeoxyribonuclease RuvC [Pseudoflavitalea sp. G-6-1-2]NML20519.1 crossover junction endodeoxyribonuclease RuvC [Pseudoflavitalea sp. G-6-1-2]